MPVPVYLCLFVSLSLSFSLALALYLANLLALFPAVRRGAAVGAGQHGDKLWLERCRYIPLRLNGEERKLLTLLEVGETRALCLQHHGAPDGRAT